MPRGRRWSVEGNLERHGLGQGRGVTSQEHCWHPRWDTVPMHNMRDVANLNCWWLVKNQLESLIDESVKFDPSSLAEGSWEPLS